MQVYFDSSQKIAGCQIENYLLEKSRVVMQLEGERNFHIFYMLCVATTTQVRAALRLENPQDYNYLNQSGCIQVDGMDDVREFEDVMTALKKLDFSDDEIMNMWKVAAAVLHCGNIKFDPNGADACTIHGGSKSSVENLAELLGVDLKAISKTLIKREITLRGETVAVDLNVEKAIAGRDALSKSLYGHLFDWLVVRTNKSMVGSGSITSGNFIGILDIFGFEIFKSNSFEQLCINFCNEKLQQHFNRNTFVLEEDTYKSEGIEFDHIEYIDNQDILNMIEKKPKGILVILDDEVSVPRGSDRGFYNKICKIHKGNSLFLQTRK
jgi:myosin heavy subunit